MNRKDPEYPVELETQFILRLPEEPAKALREVLKTGESFKNRLSIQIDNEMRHGQVQFDHRLLHGKILDLPTIIESLKTIDTKSVYKTADISQIMICKEEIEPIEEESPTKTKKKDPFKVDKKFLFPHGITPPTKNVRKRRFRKTLKKKSMEAPEIEKEVKRLLRADNEAINVKWEVITEEDESKPETSTKAEKIELKKDQSAKSKSQSNQSSSKVEDIFGGTLSDSDLEEDNINVDIDDSHMSAYDDHFSDSSMLGSREMKGFATQFSSEMFSPSTSTTMNTYGGDASYSQGESSSASMKLQQVAIELEELRQRKQKTQNEIAGMENMTLRQRFLDILQTLNKEMKLKEIEYKNLQTKSRLN